MLATILAYIATAVIFFYILRWLLRLLFDIVFSPVVIFAAVGTAIIVAVVVLIRRRREAAEVAEDTAPEPIVPAATPSYPDLSEVDNEPEDEHDYLDLSDITGLPFKFMIDGNEYSMENIDDVQNWPVFTTPFSVNEQEYHINTYFRFCEEKYRENGRPDIADALKERAGEMEWDPVQGIFLRRFVPDLYHEEFEARAAAYQQHRAKASTMPDAEFLEQVRYDEAIWRREQMKQASMNPPEEVASNLVDCPVCGKLISTKAVFCPHCGCPVRQAPPANTPPSLIGSFLHIAGLDLQKGTFCSLSCSPEFISMNAPFRSFHLSQDSIHDVSVIPYSELLTLAESIYPNEQISQSAKDTLKTTIDISSKKRFIQPHTKFLLITYTGEDDEGHIITFQLNDGNAKAAQRLASQYAEQAESQDVFL